MSSKFCPKHAYLLMCNGAMKSTSTDWGRHAKAIHLSDRDIHVRLGDGGAGRCSRENRPTCRGCHQDPRGHERTFPGATCEEHRVVRNGVEDRSRLPL